MRRLDDIALRAEPPFADDVADAIDRLDAISPEDERETDPDYEPWLGRSISGHIGASSDLEHEDVDSARNAPFELDQTEKRHG